MGGGLGGLELPFWWIWYCSLGVGAVVDGGGNYRGCLPGGGFGGLGVVFVPNLALFGSSTESWMGEVEHFASRDQKSFCDASPNRVIFFMVCAATAVESVVIKEHILKYYVPLILTIDPNSY